MLPKDNVVLQHANSVTFKIQYRNELRHVVETYSCKDKLEFYSIIKDHPELGLFAKGIDFGIIYVNVNEVVSALKGIVGLKSFALKFKDCQIADYYGPEWIINRQMLNLIIQNIDGLYGHLSSTSYEISEC